MKSPNPGKLWLFAAGAVQIACASSPAINLDPSKLTPQDGVLVGRVTATNRDEDETKHCVVEFETLDHQRLAYLSLDESGWVFATVPPGRAILSYVGCTIYAAVTQSVAHQVRMEVNVLGGKQAAYFGDVSVAFESQKKNLFVEALTPPLAKTMIPSKRTASEHQVKYDLPGAARELTARYGAAVQQLALVQASHPPADSAAAGSAAVSE